MYNLFFQKLNKKIKIEIVQVLYIFLIMELQKYKKKKAELHTFIA